MSLKDIDEIYDGPYSFDDEFEDYEEENRPSRDNFNDDDSDEILDDYDEDAESYEEAFQDAYDDDYEPFDDVEPEDGYTNMYKYDDSDDLLDADENYYDDEE